MPLIVMITKEVPKPNDLDQMIAIKKMIADVDIIPLQKMMNQKEILLAREKILIGFQEGLNILHPYLMNPKGETLKKRPLKQKSNVKKILMIQMPMIKKQNPKSNLTWSKLNLKVAALHQVRVQARLQAVLQKIQMTKKINVLKKN